MPDALNSFIGFLIVTAVLSIWVLKKKNDTWTGEVIDKKHKEIFDEDGENSVDKWFLIIKTTGNKKKKVNVKKEDFDNANIGDKYQKQKGQMTPTKI